MTTINGRLKNAWNAFIGRDPTVGFSYSELGQSSGINPSRIRLIRGNAKSIVSSVYNQIAVDCSSININHVRLNEDGRFVEVIDDDLNRDRKSVV